MLNTARNDRGIQDYLYKLQIDIYDTRGLPQTFHNILKANITFIKKLNDFKQFINCLSGDLCFKLWVRETEEALEHSAQYVCDYAYRAITEEQFITGHRVLSKRILDLTCRIYEGHWEYGVSQETDQQFDDLTELCRRIWSKESNAWLALAKAWQKVELGYQNSMVN